MSRCVLAISIVAMTALGITAAPRQVARTVRTEPVSVQTASLRGHVIKGPEGTPLRFAQVEIESVDGRDRVTATATADGAFEFAALAAGRYRVMASAPGFAITEWDEDVSAGKPGRIVQVGDGRTEDIVIRVSPGGVISGRIVNAAGAPVDGIPVFALRSERYLGREIVRPLSTRPRYSDDNGMFRLFGLERGAYYVAAVPGRLGGEIGGDMPGYGATYFPGTQSSSSARIIDVFPGREYQAGDLPIATAPISTVAGVVVTAAGKPAPNVELVLAVRSGPGRALLARSTSSDTGRFSFSNLPEGDYLLQNLPTAAPEFGSMTLKVRGVNVETVLRMRPAATLRGAVEFEGARPGLAPRGLGLVLRYADSEKSPLSRGARITVADNGELEATNIWGPQFIQWLSPPPGWMVKTVLLGSDDFAGRPLDLDSRDRSEDIRIVLTNIAATVSGNVVLSDGSPAKGSMVLVFSEDETRWPLDVRSVQSAQVDEAGHFTSPGLPPDSYLIAALNRLDRREWPPAPEVLNALRPVATRIPMSTPVSRTVTLRVVQPVQ